MRVRFFFVSGMGDIWKPQLRRWASSPAALGSSGSTAPGPRCEGASRSASERGLPGGSFRWLL